MMVNFMIEEMRKSVPDNDIIPQSNGEKIYRNMLDQEYGRMLSEAGGLGITDLVLAEIKGKR
jgi:Rod binding domain-containing protein